MDLFPTIDDEIKDSFVFLDECDNLKSLNELMNKKVHQFINYRESFQSLLNSCLMKIGKFFHFIWVYKHGNKAILNKMESIENGKDNCLVFSYSEYIKMTPICQSLLESFKMKKFFYNILKGENLFNTVINDKMTKYKEYYQKYYESIEKISELILQALEDESNKTNPLKSFLQYINITSKVNSDLLVEINLYLIEDLYEIERSLTEFMNINQFDC